MCGILGAFNLTQEDRSVFQNILSLSQNRGPDSTGNWEDEQVRFGFNRLSILDITEAGNQPVLSPSQRYVLVFNGEIYNFKDLVSRYRISSQKLRSSSDTEVIAQLLDILPFEKLTGELNGMFALAVYDKLEKKLWLTRDFAGIKPLFYSAQGDRFYFASQFDQVFSFPSIKKKLTLRPDVVKEYMALGYMQAPNTVFQNIFQCEPGETITFHAQEGLKNIKATQFFWPNKNYTVNETSPEASDSFPGLLKQVVNDQLVSDVPLACFLSGGIDSPLVCASAAGSKPGIHAFTVGTSDAATNEAEIAKRYAAHLSLTHDVAYFSESDLLSIIDDHFKSFPEPFGDYSSLPTYMITKRAKASAAVMLSGDGGDEVFWGYPRFLKMVNNQNWFNYPLLLRRPAAGVLRKFNAKISYGVSSFNTIGEWALHQQIHNERSFLETFIPDCSFSPELKKLYDAPHFNNKESLLQWLRWNEYYGHLQRVLVKVDRASMANSMEIRVPFLDKRMLSYAESIKPELGIHHTSPKWILKKAMDKFYPSSLIQLDKKGFEVPLKGWLKTVLREEIESKLIKQPLFGNAFMNEAAIKKYINDFFEGKHSYAWGIWILYAWQKWATRYNF